jgi:hypothetical protein
MTTLGIEPATFRLVARGMESPGKAPVPIVHEAGWTQGQVCMAAENLAPPGFDPRTVHPVASRYTV